MGKKSEFTRSRFKEVRQKREERAQRSRDVRDRRHGIDKSERKIEKVMVQRALPDETSAALLLRQFAQACRLAAPSTDMCLLMRHYAALAESTAAAAGTSAAATSSPAKPAQRKRAREEAEATEAATGDAASLARGVAYLNELADALLQTQSTPAVLEEAAAAAADTNDSAVAAAGAEDAEDEDTLTVLQDILQDDSGRRVVSTLLAALSAVHSDKCGAVATAVLEQFEEDEHLPHHHVACRVMSALVQFGTPATRQRVLDLLRQRATSTEAVVQLLSDRHTAGTIERLLEHHRQPTAAWLCEVLSLTSSTVAPAKKGKKKQQQQQPVEGEESEMTMERLMELINGSVSGQVLLQLVHTDARRELLKRLSVTDLLQSKRGTTFLTQLLTLSAPAEAATTTATATTAASEAEAVALLDDLLERLGGDLGLMAIDKRANFVVQAMVQLLPVTGAQSQQQLQRLQRALGGEAGLAALVAHGNGVHVVLALIDVVMQLPGESAAEDLAEQIVTRQSVKELLHHHHGSLVVRRLMPLVARKASKVGRLLQGMVEQDMSNLVYTEAGNLVVQAYLKALGRPAASLVAQKLANTPEELLAMCRSPFAAHVVFALFELVDPTTHTLLCTTMKPYVLRLSTHVNGRFIVEKMIAASRDIRDDVASQFTALAQERGTQHLLCALLASMDARGKKSVIDRAIMPHFTDLATHQCGSIALQKLMQAEPTLLAAVRERLSGNSLVRSDLAQNFFGKFVVQIAQQQQ